MAISKRCVNKYGIFIKITRISEVLKTILAAIQINKSSYREPLKRIKIQETSSP